MALEWLFLTLLSTVTFSALDLIEKHLISARIKSPLLLAIFLAVFYPINLIAILLFFPVDFAPFPSMASFVIGAAMGIAYLLFMKALYVEEVSRVVTLHYTYPLFVAPIAFFFLNEDLTFSNYAGIVLLVASTIMISYRKVGKSILYSPALLLMIALNLVIAAENVIAKYLFDLTNFWSFIFWLTSGLIAIRIALLLMPSVRRDFTHMVFDRKVIGYGFATAFLFLASNMLYYGAVSIQLVSLVSALSAIQPLILLGMAVMISYVRPGYVHEELSKGTMLIKIVAVFLVFIGTYLITTSS
jgi:drug/metabolite transporter (DMT)-like permease